ncbi:MAG: protein phosphatase 2C domain-containing protein [Betaproteobacteria bacterium]|nr:protein phosphatase 2C domain-containing protein [Betaproteobacteria bacterium]
MPLVIDACLAHDIGDRTEQQDLAAIIKHPRGALLAVLADGMGGHTGGALASSQVVHTFRNNFEHFSIQEDSPSGLLNTCLNEAHTLIKTSRFISEQDPHSTAVALLITPGKAHWVHCGDSRLYHFQGDQLVQRTSDHSYVESLVQKKIISEQEALIHPRRNMLLSALGGEENPLISMDASNPLHAGDSFLLSSDGLWHYFTSEELGMIVSAYSARESSEMLVAHARKRAHGEGDNISLIIIKLLEAPSPNQGPPHTNRVRIDSRNRMRIDSRFPDN